MEQQLTRVEDLREKLETGLQRNEQLRSALVKKTNEGMKVKS